MLNGLDPRCLIHGKRASEHDCLYCCLCFKSLTLEECSVGPDGIKEDVCKPCAAIEQATISRIAAVGEYRLTDTEAVEL